MKVKKIISILTVISIFIGVSFQSGTAYVNPTGLSGGDYKYSVNNNEATITDYIGSEQELEIPDVIDGYSVTAIGKEAFERNADLTKVTIPDSITYIGEGAFSYCYGLLSVELSENISVIEKRVFYNCRNLADITIPENVTSIGQSAFSSCWNLSEINIPEKVQIINSYAFDSCRSLLSVAIPGSVKTIGEEAFIGCEKLEKLTIEQGVEEIGSMAFFECVSLSEITIPDSVKNIAGDSFEDTAYYNNTDNWVNGNLYINNALIKANANVEGEYIIPETTTALAGSAFKNCINITKVNIPEGITNIGSYTFSGCDNLTDVVIPNSVTSIGRNAFSYCPNLAEIYLPDNITSIGDDAFWDTQFYENSDNWNEKVLYIGKYLIKAERTLNVPYKIPEGTKTIANGAFEECRNLSLLFIPESVTDIGNGAFYECEKLMSIFYQGSEEQWKNINIGTEDNYDLTKGKIHYNNYAGGKYQKTVAPTCYTDGYDLYYCDVHKETYKTNYVSALGHTRITPKKKKPTYFEKGSVGGYICKRCEITLVKGSSIAKLKLKTPTLKVTGSKKTIKVKYNKVKDATGFKLKYQIGKKIVVKTYNTKKSVTKTIKNLKKGTYKVSACSFIKQGSRIAFSDWSKAKKVKVK